MSYENPVHRVVPFDSREVLEASTVTLAPDRNWKARLFPSLSSDFAENSAERERQRQKDRQQRDETDRTAYHDARRQQKVNKILSHCSQRRTIKQA